MASVLVMDDDGAIRELIREALERVGHRVVEAENGTHGLRALAAERFDLVITDILMPDGEGIETIRAIRMQSRPVPILAISGGGPHRQLDYLHVAEVFGADRSLAKPFRARELLRAVEDLLTARR